ncbi:MAG: sensor histidine kinase [Roseivirga sp.]|nr:sensor histidine kinase [Roseivirga sp.]
MGETSEVNLVEIILIGMLGMFLLGFAVVAFFIVYQRRLLKQQEANQQIKEEYQKNLLRASVDSQEKERQRIAEALHDEVGALITTSKLHIGQIKPDTPEAKLTERLSSATDILTETLQSVRQISLNLKPPVLEALGLVAAIRSLIQKINTSGKVEISCSGPDELMVPAEESLGCYRIVQELLQNGLKHAQATEIELDIQQIGRSIQIDYQDNGIGFDFDKMASSDKGLGLRNIQSRLNLLNGTISAQNRPDGGTHLRIETFKSIQAND